MPEGKTMNRFSKKLGRPGGCDFASIHRTHQVPVNNQLVSRLKGSGGGLWFCTCAGFQGVQVFSLTAFISVQIKMKVPFQSPFIVKVQFLSLSFAFLSLCLDQLGCFEQNNQDVPRKVRLQ